jgi:2-C-methyl-D-erythritol 2,4-cyclodiphosphate synthase
MKKFSHPTGFGFDSHSFSGKGILMLGGLSFAGYPILKGHSDGDAVLHSLIDSLLGAASLGDIGDHFPDTDKSTKGISSVILLRRVLLKIEKSGYRPAHVDVTVVADRPRLTPHKETMARELAGLLRIQRSSVNVKAKTPEGLNLFKRPGGVAVWSVATLELIKSQ